MATKEMQRVGDMLGLSIQVIALTATVIIVFGIYLGVLIYGDKSLTVLIDLKHEKRSLLKEASDLKSENQRLQKDLFELKQLQTVEE